MKKIFLLIILSLTAASYAYAQLQYIPWAVVRGEDAEYVNNDHALTVGEIGTFVYPYAIEQTRGGIVYSLEKRNSDDVTGVTEITLVEATYPLKAGYPYVFIATTGALEALEGVDYVETAEYCDNGLIGYLDIIPGAATTKAITGENKYIIYGNEVRLCGANCAVKNGLAYIDMAQVSTGALESALKQAQAQIQIATE